MSHISIVEELCVIKKAIGLHDYGVGILALNRELVAQEVLLSLRTLQRRLSTLKRTASITSIGKGRSTLYKLVRVLTYPLPYCPKGYEKYAIHQESATFGKVHTGEPGLAADPILSSSYLPISDTGACVREEVRKRCTHTFLPYDATLLTQYRPNIDFYLNEESRRHLHVLGRTPFENSESGAHAKYLFQVLLVDFCWASSRLSGYTGTRLEILRFIEHQQIPVNRSNDEIQLIENHQEAFQFLINDLKISSNAMDIDTYILYNLHAIVTHNLVSSVNEEHHGSSPSHDEKRALQIMFLDKYRQICDPFEQSFFCLAHLPYARFFMQGNRRLSRLMANVSLIQHNLCPMTFIDMSELAYTEGNLGVIWLHRVDLLRDVFIWAYQRASCRYLSREPIMLVHLLMFKYRRAVMACIQAIVLHNLSGTSEEIERFAANAIDPENNEMFIQMVQNELRYLCPGNIARYRIRRDEFEDWQWKNKENQDYGDGEYTFNASHRWIDPTSTHMP